jgi:hypothetical protein
VYQLYPSAIRPLFVPKSNDGPMQTDCPRSGEPVVSYLVEFKIVDEAV